MLGFAPLAVLAIASSQPNFNGVLGIDEFSVSQPTYGAVALSSKHAFGIANFTAASPVVNFGQFKEIHGLIISSVNPASPSYGPVSFASQHIFTVSNFTPGSPDIPILTLSAKHTLLPPTFSTVNPTLGPVTLTSRHTLSITNVGPVTIDIGLIVATAQIVYFEIEPWGIAHADYEFDASIDAEVEDILEVADVELEEAA